MAAKRHPAHRASDSLQYAPEKTLAAHELVLEEVDQRSEFEVKRSGGGAPAVFMIEPSIAQAMALDASTS
jgi:hypothetical protein